MDQVSEKNKMIEYKIKQLFKILNCYDLDGYAVPKNDEFFSEYSIPNRLMNISGFLIKEKKGILEANSKDVENAKSNSLSEPMINRLILTSEKMDQLSQDVEKIAQMPDPLNQELESWSNPSNGLNFSKIS